MRHVEVAGKYVNRKHYRQNVGLLSSENLKRCAYDQMRIHYAEIQKGAFGSFPLAHSPSRSHFMMER